MEAARQVYNACLGISLRRARLLRERRAYRKARRQTRGEERTAAFKGARRSVEFSDAALQRYAVRLRQRAFLEHLDVHVAQKLGSRAFLAANEWLLGKRGRPRFKGYRQLDTVEGKSNHAGLRWRDDHVEWFGLNLPAIIDTTDPVIRHALGCRVKYVRLVRRKLRGRDRFYAQLIRQRRANNQDNYLPDGRVKPGPKRWVRSVRQRRTQDELGDLLRREAAHRKTLHGELASRILAMGRVIKTEKLSYRAWQRRYGKSVSVRAPGKFLSILRRKAESAGGSVIEFPAHRAKLSQICHGCGATHKKPLSLRVHVCECGVEMQRDLYSAFLARCVGEDGMLHADQARMAWSGAEPLLRAAWSEATQPASGRAFRPSSFGAAPRSRSGSPAEEGTAKAEARNVVAHVRACGESPGEAAAVPLRTPRL